jgi:hypothetical protein
MELFRLVKSVTEARLEFDYCIDYTRRYRYAHEERCHCIGAEGPSCMSPCPFAGSLYAAIKIDPTISHFVRSWSKEELIHRLEKIRDRAKRGLRDHRNGILYLKLVASVSWKKFLSSLNAYEPKEDKCNRDVRDGFDWYFSSFRKTIHPDLEKWPSSQELEVNYSQSSQTAVRDFAFPSIE